LKTKIKTKTLISRPRPRAFCGVYQRPTEKHFSFSAVNENADENEIPFTVENENESHLIILVKSNKIKSIYFRNGGLENRYTG